MNFSGMTMSKLQKDTLQLYDLLRYMKNKSSEIEKAEFEKNENAFVGTMRKINIAQVLSNKKVICISGLQGAGKTTMLKNLYELDEGILKTNQGRGEKFPIFVIEHQGGIEYAKLSFDHKSEVTSIKEEILTHDEFITVASDGARTEDTIMLLLKLPMRYFLEENEGGFLLLPGFETRKIILDDGDDESGYWKELVNFCAACADLNIMTISPNVLADSENDEIVKKMQQMKLSKDSIYAITNAEGILVDEKKGSNILKVVWRPFMYPKKKKKE